MKAIVQTEYGSPDVLRLAEVAEPIVGDREVLVQVQAASVSAGDWHLMRGTPYFIRFIFGGLRQPKIPILGSSLAGRVAAVGPHVTEFQPGDEVMGEVSASGFGAFAEYVCAAAAAFVSKPTNLSFEAAAAVPTSALAALQGLRDVGQLQPGQTVLVNGASGGVGSFAVQIAKALGATVTAVSSPAKLEMVRQLGADAILDYTQTDITHSGSQYDLILDTAAYRPFWDYLPALTATGTYVLVGGGTDRFLQAALLGPWFSKVSDRTVAVLESQPNPADLGILRDLLASGKLVPYLDRTFPLSAVPAAIRYLEQRQVRGKVVIRILT